MTYFTEIEIQVCMKSQKTSISQSNPENKAGVITLPNFKLYNKAIVMKVIKTEWYWHKTDI